MFRSLMALSPPDVLPAVYLSSNKLASSFEVGLFPFHIYIWCICVCGLCLWAWGLWEMCDTWVCVCTSPPTSSLLVRGINTSFLHIPLYVYLSVWYRHVLVW